MDQDERIDIYTIPPNFAEEGTMLSGRIRTRNAVETAIILMVLIPLLLSLDCAVKTKMYIGMIGIVPIVILAVIGVQGESLFAFIGSFFQYLGRRRYLTVPDDRYRLEQNRRKEKGQKSKDRKGGKTRGGRRKDKKQKGETAGKQGMETETQADQAGSKEGAERESRESEGSSETGKKKPRIRRREGKQLS